MFDTLPLDAVDRLIELLGRLSSAADEVRTALSG
jgi:hypothetical protein